VGHRACRRLYCCHQPRGVIVAEADQLDGTVEPATLPMPVGAEASTARLGRSCIVFVALTVIVWSNQKIIGRRDNAPERDRLACGPWQSRKRLRKVGLRVVLYVVVDVQPAPCESCRSLPQRPRPGKVEPTVRSRNVTIAHCGENSRASVGKGRKAVLQQ